MDYSFFALNSLPLPSMYQGVPYIAFKGIVKGRIRAIARHMEGQETSDSDPCQGKIQKDLDFCTHPDVCGFRGQTRVYTRERV